MCMNVFVAQQALIVSQLMEKVCIVGYTSVHIAATLRIIVMTDTMYYNTTVKFAIEMNYMIYFMPMERICV